MHKKYFICHVVYLCETANKKLAVKNSFPSFSVIYPRHPFVNSFTRFIWLTSDTSKYEISPIILDLTYFL